jgi:exosortase/archaeosortase family protein
MAKIKTKQKTTSKNLQDNRKRQIKPNIKDRIKKFKPYIQFGVIFLIVVSVYYMAVMFLSDTFFSWYIDSTAKLANIILNLIGSGTSAIGEQIFSAKYSISLSFGCEGTEPIILLVAAIIAFPIKFKYKVSGLTIGILVLYILNLIRIAALYLIGESFPDSVELFHVEIFPVIFIFLAIIIWGIWIKWAIKQTKAATKS